MPLPPDDPSQSARATPARGLGSLRADEGAYGSPVRRTCAKVGYGSPWSAQLEVSARAEGDFDRHVEAVRSRRGDHSRLFAVGQPEARTGRLQAIPQS